ncbi:hypothetical protein C5167_009070 [Papaver somniferum]|uniref:Uncharacterized protein n=1 Tax=Papaver somniferum TaxID=3469 RepID=A0A4Y7JXS5_PAPSO|nr:hypothetical protein C5167_009070 [Papaver somniferum]
MKARDRLISKNMLKLLLVLIQDSEGKGSRVELDEMGIGIWMSWNGVEFHSENCWCCNEEHEMMFGVSGASSGHACWEELGIVMLQWQEKDCIYVQL